MSMISSQYAVYLPAVNSSYAKEVLKALPANRSFPQGLDLQDLIFWDRNNRLWHHNEILHSVGLHKYGSVIDNAVTRMGQTDCFLVGDSGGFQIGKGELKGYKPLHKRLTSVQAMDVWRDAYELKRWIVSWLETHCDYAMTLDMPLWATMEGNAKSPFHKCSVAELTALTAQNLKFIDSHRENRTKWLNVIQGLDTDSIKAWWDAVKWFDCEGYALAGKAGADGGIVQVLRTLLTMRDDGAFMHKHRWLHVLGVSTPQWAIYLTAIQQALRESVGTDIRVSFDSSSPYRTGGEFEQICEMPTFEQKPSTWTIKAVNSPQSLRFYKSTECFGFESPLGRLMTMGDLNVKGGDWDYRTFDTVSNLMLVNHNVWTYLQAFETANTVAFDGGDGQVPYYWQECIKFIRMIFKADNWRNELDNNKTLSGNF